MAWIAPVMTGAIASSVAPIDLYSLPTVANLEVWVNANNDVTGDPVTLWEDKGPAGRDITFTGSSVTVSSNTYNAKPAVNFDTAVATGASHTTPTNSSQWTIFLVCTTDDDTIWISQSNNRQFRIRFNNNEEMSFFNGTNYVSSTLPNAAINLNTYTLRYDGGTSLRMFQNGTQVFNDTPSNVSINWNEIFSGNNFNNAGDCTDLIMYSSVLSVSEMNIIGDNIRTFYGAALPAWTPIV